MWQSYFCDKFAYFYLCIEGEVMMLMSSFMSDFFCISFKENDLDLKSKLFYVICQALNTYPSSMLLVSAALQVLWLCVKRILYFHSNYFLIWNCLLLYFGFWAMLYKIILADSDTSIYGSCKQHNPLVFGLDNPARQIPHNFLWFSQFWPKWSWSVYLILGASA